MNIIFVFGAIWHLVGMVLTNFYFEFYSPVFIDSMDYLSYKWVSETYCEKDKTKNIILCICLNLLMPLVSIAYWVYRLGIWLGEH